MRCDHPIRQSLFNFTLATEDLRTEFQRFSFFRRQVLATLGAGAVDQRAHFLHALLRGAEFGRFKAQVIQPQHNILARHDNGLAIRRAQDVVGGHHQYARFQLRFQAERHMHRHLVAVEIGIEGGADQRVKLDRLTFNQHRFKRLNAQTVQSRRAVQQHRVFADNFFQNIPNFRAFLFHHPLGRLDGGGVPVFLKLGIDEGLEEFERHLLRQAALMELQFRPHHNHRTARIIHALAEQVLTEAALLALQHIGKRLQRTLIRPRNRATTPAIVEQRIHRFLQHALFIAHNDIRRAQFDQPLQAVIAVDDAAIKIIQIRRRKTPAIQRHQRAEFRRDHRHNIQDHPLRMRARFREGFHQLQALHELLALGFGCRVLQFGAQRDRFLLKLDPAQHLLHGFRADTNAEGILTEFIQLRLILIFVQQLTQLKVREARFQHHIAFEVQNLLQLLQRHIHHQPHAGRQGLQEPDMCDRARQFDMAHALAAHLGQRHFHAAFFANDAAELHPLILAAKALIILDRAKDPRAEKPIPLRLEGAVIDGFRLLDLAIGPGADLLRARHGDLDLVKSDGLTRLTQDFHKLVHAANLLSGAAATKASWRLSGERIRLS